MVDTLAALPPDMTPHLRVLRASLTRMAATSLPGPARVALAEAQVALAALEGAQGAVVDRRVFDALMELAGPDLAPDLVTQMAADLRMVQMTLARSLAGPDWNDVRGQTHILMALAGSAGAHRLEQGARALNLAAHAADAARAQKLTPEILAGLEQLIRFVDAAGATVGARP